MRHGGAEPRGRSPAGVGMCLLLGATGVGKTLLVERLQTIFQCWARGPGGLGCGWGGAPGVTRTRGRRTPKGGVGVAPGAGEGPWGCRGRLGAGSGRRPLSSAPLGVLDCPAQLSSQDGKGDLGDPPATRPTVGFRSPAGLVEMVPLAVCKVLWVLLMETGIPPVH